MSFVGSEIVPVVFEIRPFASAHQCFRSRTVKTEVPDAGVVINALPSGNAWEKRIHHYELFYFGRELRGVRIGDHQPDIVSDNSRLLNTE